MFDVESCRRIKRTIPELASITSEKVRRINEEFISKLNETRIAGDVSSERTGVVNANRAALGT